MISVDNRKPAEKMSLDEMLDCLDRAKLRQIPKQIIMHLRVVQAFGNYGAHSHTQETYPVSQSSAGPAIASLGHVAAWYAGDYEGKRRDASTVEEYELREVFWKMTKDEVTSSDDGFSDGALTFLQIEGCILYVDTIYGRKCMAQLAQVAEERFRLIDENGGRVVDRHAEIRYAKIVANNWEHYYAFHPAGELSNEACPGLIKL